MMEMTGYAYKKVYDILHANLTDILPDGHIIKIAQSVCTRVNGISVGIVLTEMEGTYLHNIKEDIVDKMNEVYCCEPQGEESRQQSK